MAEGKSVLFEMLVEDLGSRFLREYSERTKVIYKEAESRSYKDDGIHEALKPYYYGQTRFALHQTMFIRLAGECGMTWDVQRCAKNGFPTPVVSAGRFFFTDHYGETPQEVSLDASSVRFENSAINEAFIEPTLFEPTVDDAKLREAEKIYGNFVHGCHGHGSDFSTQGFLRIAFPYPAGGAERSDSTQSQSAEQGAPINVRFAANYPLAEVLAKVVEREVAAKKDEVTVDIAIPRIRTSASNS